MNERKRRGQRKGEIDKPNLITIHDIVIAIFAAKCTTLHTHNRALALFCDAIKVFALQKQQRR